MPENQQQNITEIKDLTDKDFYQQACAYFYYHAEQRTTMINYFIAVFAACIALYGSLIADYSLASTLIAVFLLIVSVLFYYIDLRNRFDVKQSQNVISQIERDYGIHLPSKNGGQYAYGVFSNEDNTFRYYGYKKRRGEDNEEYRQLRKLYHLSRKLSRKGLPCDEIDQRYLTQKEAFLRHHPHISAAELENSMPSGSIITLSFSIKMLYYVCMVISFLAFLLALFITLHIF